MNTIRVTNYNAENDQIFNITFAKTDFVLDIIEEAFGIRCDKTIVLNRKKDQINSDAFNGCLVDTANISHSISWNVAYCKDKPLFITSESVFAYMLSDRFPSRFLPHDEDEWCDLVVLCRILTKNEPEVFIVNAN